MIEPHKFVLSYMGYCMCGLFHDDPIHQQESQQCGSCAGNLPNHEEGCFYKLAQESQPATHPAEAPEGLRAVEAFYKAELDQARQRIKELEAMLNKSISLASIGYRIGEADMRCHDKIGERYGKMQDDLISEINTLLKERIK